MTDEGKTFINKSINKKFRTESVSRTHQTIDFLAKYFSDVLSYFLPHFPLASPPVATHWMVRGSPSLNGPTGRELDSCLPLSPSMRGVEGGTEKKKYKF